MIEHTVGLIAAPCTPMHEGGAVDLDRIAVQAEHLARNGVVGVFCCGTTGEGLSLAEAERKAVTRQWVTAAPGDFKVIVHVGHASLAVSKSLAADAQRLGVSAIGSLPPTFYRPKCVDDLADYCAQIASAAPELPFYYYHIPSMSGVTFPMIEFLQAAADRVETFAGMKYTHEDLMDYGMCLRAVAGGYDMLFGRDEMMLGAAAFGARGFVGATYNFAAPLYRRLLDAFDVGDMDIARRAQHDADRLVAVMRTYGGVRAVKAIMQTIGVDCGPCRLPLRTLSPDEYANLRSDLEEIGFFEFCSR